MPPAPPAPTLTGLIEGVPPVGSPPALLMRPLLLLPAPAPEQEATGGRGGSPPVGAATDAESGAEPASEGDAESSGGRLPDSVCAGARGDVAPAPAAAPPAAELLMPALPLPPSGGDAASAAPPNASGSIAGGDGRDDSTAGDGRAAATVHNTAWQ